MFPGAATSFPKWPLPPPTPHSSATSSADNHAVSDSTWASPPQRKKKRVHFGLNPVQSLTPQVDRKGAPGQSSQDAQSRTAAHDVDIRHITKRVPLPAPQGGGSSQALRHGACPVKGNYVTNVNHYDTPRDASRGVS